MRLFLAAAIAFSVSAQIRSPQFDVIPATSTTPGKICFWEARANGTERVCFSAPPAIASGFGYTIRWPANDGSLDRAMVHDGTGQLNWVEVVTTATDQTVSGIKTFGARIEANAGINSLSNIRVNGTTVINPSRAGFFTNVAYSSTSGFNVFVSAPAGMSAAWNMILPPNDGNPGEVLSTDGSGNLTWATSTCASCVTTDTTQTITGFKFFSSGSGVRMSGLAVDGNIYTGLAGSATTSTIAINGNGDGNRAAMLDLVTDDTNAYGLRLVRGVLGVNTPSDITHKGTGSFYITTENAAPLTIRTNGTDRWSFLSGGNLTPATENQTIGATGFRVANVISNIISAQRASGINGAVMSSGGATGTGNVTVFDTFGTPAGRLGDTGLEIGGVVRISNIGAGSFAGVTSSGAVNPSVAFGSPLGSTSQAWGGVYSNTLVAVSGVGAIRATVSGSGNITTFDASGFDAAAMGPNGFSFQGNLGSNAGTVSCGGGQAIKTITLRGGIVTGVTCGTP